MDNNLHNDPHTWAGTAGGMATVIMAHILARDILTARETFIAATVSVVVSMSWRLLFRWIKKHFS